LVPQLAGAMILLCMISPQIRLAFFGMGFLALCLIGFAVVGLIGFGVYRWPTRTDSPSSMEASPQTKTTLVPSQQNVTNPVYVQSSQISANGPALNSPRNRASTQVSPPQSPTEILEQLHAIDWFQFEKLVALMYRKLGYTVTRRGGANPDGGIDLVIEKNGMRSAVQCKQWKTWNVGVKAVREFLGALTDARIQKGIFITLCGYTGDARQLAEKHGIEIVNEKGLKQMRLFRNLLVIIHWRDRG
jgi:restriction endonuclease Mrr